MYEREQIGILPCFAVFVVYCLDCGPRPLHHLCLSERAQHQSDSWSKPQVPPIRTMSSQVLPPDLSYYFVPSFVSNPVEG